MPPEATTEPQQQRTPTPSSTQAGEAGARNGASNYAQVLIATIAVLAACYFAKLIFLVLMVSVLLAFVLAPIPDLLERARIPRALGALIAVLLLCGVIFGAVTYSYNAAQDF